MLYVKNTFTNLGKLAYIKKGKVQKKVNPESFSNVQGSLLLSLYGGSD